MRWRNPEDEHALDVWDHAKTWSSVAVRRVRDRPASCTSPADALQPVIRDALVEAYQAGARFGRAEAQQGLDHIIRDAVEDALGKVRKNVRATCPDCGGRGCDECRGTGYFDQRGR